MTLLTSFWAVDLLFLFIITLLLYKYLTRKYDYFQIRNIPFKKPIPFFGNFFPVLRMKVNIGEWLLNLCKANDEPYFGIFVLDDPCLVIKSPDIIKQILVKDFNFFVDRTILAPKHDEIVCNMLFMQKNPEWKKMRNKMTPAFTSGKLKGMLPIINEVAEDLVQYLKKNLGVLDAKEVCLRFSTDVIAKCAFAINPHSFDEKDSEFQQARGALFDFTWRNSFSQSCCFLKPKLASFLRLLFFEERALTYLKNTFWEAVKEREQTHIKRNDLVDIILDMRKNKDLCDELNFVGDKVVAQAVQFFAAGFETASSTISFTLYELSTHPEVQDKLREEILSNIKEHNGITYKGLMSMKYMEMCLFETLRKYPPLPFLDRRCNEDYHVAGTNLVIEKGMPVYIPLLSLHYDDSYFPDPERYDPERFADKNTHNVDGLYYIPFGEGPRICIGERFGLLEVKTALMHILSEFEIEKIPRTPTHIKFEPKCFLLQSSSGLPIRFKKIQQ